jgi:hypothetical protein
MIVDNQVRIPPQVIEAWQHAVIHFIPPQLKRKTVGHTDDARVHFLIQQHADALQTLWKAYTSERGSLGKYPTTSMAGAYPYLLGFHLPNAARMELILERVWSEKRLSLELLKPRAVAIYDLGVGTGAMSSTLVSHLIGRHGYSAESMQVEMVDRSGAFLDIARVVLSSQLAEERIRALKMSLDEYDLSRSLSFLKEAETVRFILLGYVWNEIEKNRRMVEPFLASLDRLAKSGSPAVIAFADSSNEYQARSAQQFRDVLATMGYSPVYPCPSNGGCPMLESEKDWCYSEGLWQQPVSMERLDKLLHVNRSRFATSGYLFVNPEAQQLMRAPVDRGQVVVGRPTIDVNGRYEYLLCTGSDIKRSPGDMLEQLRGTRRAERK